MNGIEKAISRRLIDGLLAAGKRITVDYELGLDPALEGSKDVEAIIAAMDAVDECWLMIGEGKPSYDAFLYFIWGNGEEGRTCLSDYSCSLESIVAPVSEWSKGAEMTLTEAPIQTPQQRQSALKAALAASYTERRDALGYWLKRDGTMTTKGAQESLSWLCGSAAALQATGHPDAEYIGRLAFLASVRTTEETLKGLAA